MKHTKAQIIIIYIFKSQNLCFALISQVIVESSVEQTAEIHTATVIKGNTAIRQQQY